MAGDWIKIENVTPEKPEILRIAEELGIDLDAVLGKLVRLWIWADNQTILGNAPSVTLSVIDRITGAQGFALAMQKFGWMKLNDDGAEFPNFDRHNGSTAKTRALTKRRVEKKRKGPVTQGALPEREGDSSSPKKNLRGEREQVSLSPDELDRLADLFESVHDGPPLKPGEARKRFRRFARGGLLGPEIEAAIRDESRDPEEFPRAFVGRLLGENESDEADKIRAEMAGRRKSR